MVSAVARTPRYRPLTLVVIAAGASVGTAIRAGLSTAFPVAPGTWPWVTFWINLGGAFVLGALLQTLSSTGPDEGWRRLVRLGVGTGTLGGFTTYSTFSVETVQSLRAGEMPLGIAYALVSVVIGVSLAFAAMWLVRWTVGSLRGRRTAGAA